MGAAAVAALFLLAAPAQAWAPARGATPGWRLGWAAVDLWVAAREALGWRAVVGADVSLPPEQEEQAENPSPRLDEPGKGDQGSGVDPDGLR